VDCFLDRRIHHGTTEDTEAARNRKVSAAFS